MLPLQCDPPILARVISQERADCHGLSSISIADNFSVLCIVGNLFVQVSAGADLPRGSQRISQAVVEAQLVAGVVVRVGVLGIDQADTGAADFDGIIGKPGEPVTRPTE